MRIAPFISALRQGKSAPVYYLEGPDRFLHEECRNAVVDALPPEARPWCYRAIEFQPGSLERELENASQIPMLGSRNFLFFSDPEDFRGAVDEDTETLEQYLKGPSPYSTIIFAAVEPDRRRRFIQILEKRTEKVELSPLSPREAAEWARQFCRARGVEMDVSVAQKMAEYFAVPAPSARLAGRDGVNTLWMRTELEKLLTARTGASKIALTDLQLVAGGREEREIGKMLRALAERRCGEAIDMLRRLMASKVAETLLLWCVGDLFRQSLRGSGSAGGTRSGGWAALSNPISTTEIARSARRAYSQEELLRALRLVRHADLAIKSSWKDAGLLLEILIWQITSGATRAAGADDTESEALSAG